jgi:GDP-mannose 6-dehydrogenase
MNISVLGMGYVGAVTSACLAKIGHTVTGIDIVEEKVKSLNSGKSPIVEPGLNDLIQEMVKEKRLKATSSTEKGLKNADAIIVCVGTPSLPNGGVDLSHIIKVTSEIADHLKDASKDLVIVYRSTLPPGTITNEILPVLKAAFERVKLVYHPEFLCEGSAIIDFEQPQQVVAANTCGMGDEEFELFFKNLYKEIDYVFYNVQIKTAEMIKYLNNTFHALKVAFGNEVGRICRSHGIDTHELMNIFLSDKKLNISTAYLKPGFSFGGSCLPKDLNALTTLAKHTDIEIPIISNIERSNEIHIDTAFRLILGSKCKTVGFLGLSFKPGTDDVRQSPFIKLAERCIGKGLDVNIYDRTINPKFMTGKNLEYLHGHIAHITERLVRDIDEVLNSADLILICHTDPSYSKALSKYPDKQLLDLTGNFEQQELSEKASSIITSVNK